MTPSTCVFISLLKVEMEKRSGQNSLVGIRSLGLSADTSDGLLCALPGHVYD